MVPRLLLYDEAKYHLPLLMEKEGSITFLPLKVVFQENFFGHLGNLKSFKYIKAFF